MKWLGLVRANLGRNKLRTALTGAAIMLAVALVCMLLTMPEGLNSLLEDVTSNTRISVHNKAGRLMRVVMDGQPLAPGTNLVSWDGRDTEARDVAPGMYFVTVEALGDRSTQPVGVVR